MNTTTTRFFRLRSRSLVLVGLYLFVFTVLPSSSWGQGGGTCTSAPCQYCSTVAASALLGCALSQNECFWVNSWLDNCLATGGSLPEPTPAPPEPLDSCSVNPPAEIKARLRPSAGVLKPTTTDPSCRITLIDPVPDLVNTSGTGVETVPESLATRGTIVTGIAADSAARLVIRIYANSRGDRLRVRLKDLGGANLNALPHPIGQLQTLLPEDGSASGQEVTVTANETSAGPMGFVLYIPPEDFSRGGADDSLLSRSVQLEVKFGASPVAHSYPILIERPPVVLVHGLWGDRTDWDNFSLGHVFWSKPVAYDDLVGSVEITLPIFSPSIRAEIKGNALGLDFNAPNVLRQIRREVKEYSKGRQCAAIQADVVAHSMGGLVTRTLENLSDYLDKSSFKSGSVHKLITIGTPHLGSPLAQQLLQSANSKVRNFLAWRGRASVYTASVAGRPTTGAVGDLQGDANGMNLSAALTAIARPNGHEVPTALIAARITPTNTASLDSLFSAGNLLIRATCAGDPLADNLTSTSWRTVFGNQESDGIVPESSQTNNGMGATAPAMGFVHSKGIIGPASLGFTGPHETSDGSWGQNPIPGTVVELLNKPIWNSDTQGSPFHRLP